MFNFQFAHDFYRRRLAPGVVVLIVGAVFCVPSAAGEIDGRAVSRDAVWSASACDRPLIPATVPPSQWRVLRAAIEDYKACVDAEAARDKVRLTLAVDRAKAGLVGDLEGQFAAARGGD